MFSRKLRLPANTNFSLAKTIHTPLFVLKVAKNDFLYNRYGFVVSKKIDKRATVRNRVKRVIRSCFEELNTRLVQGQDFLVIIKREAVGKEFITLQTEVAKALKSYLLI